MRSNTILRPTRRTRVWFTLSLALIASAAAAYILSAPGVVTAAVPELFISEYIEGSSNNKAIEIYNATGAPVNLATGGYNIQMFFNGNPVSTLTINLTGTVANGDVYVVAQSSANATILAQADQTNGSGWFNGDDAVVLRKGTTIIDSIGQAGFDPGTEWGTGLTSTADNTLRRKASVCGGDNNATDVFDPSIQWDGFATDTVSDLGSHTSNCFTETAPAVTTTTPTSGATGVPVSSNIVVDFNEPVSVTASAFTISCASSGSHTATVTSNGPSTSFTLNPDSDFAFTEMCTVTVSANQVTDQDVNDPPDNMAGDYVWSFTTGENPCTAAFTPIYTVQGSGSASPLAGSTVTIRGIVNGDFQGSTSFNGFYLQDPAGDGNAATSDGIFVFAPAAPNVNVGDDVVVSGTVTEFNGLTELSPVTAVTPCSTGTITPTVVDLPQASPGELERYEGMLTTIPETLTVSEVFTLGRFGELTLSSDGRMFQPTNDNAPGAPAIAAASQNELRKILLDDGKSIQNPNPIPYLSAANTRRAGDTVSGLTGILDFRFSEYRIQPTVTPTFTENNPRTAAPDAVGGNVKVSSFNVLNYFNGDGMGGGFPTERGADTPAEFVRQRDKIIAAITAINADVLGIIEMENDGGGPTSAIQDLVNGLNAVAGAGTYDFRIGTNPGTDAIMNGIIYKPGRVTPVGAAVNDVDTDGDGENAWAQARNPLAQTFQYNVNGEKFTYIVNHFTSKGCSGSDTGGDADQGDGQGCDNHQRMLQANRLLTFISDRLTAASDPDVLVMGDLNAYGKEDPITILTGGGLVNEIDLFIGTPYSFIFDAQSGYLDHALATSSMSQQVTGVTEWHINADEPIVLDYNTEFKTQDLYAPTPYRSSDHDPVIVGLDLNAPASIGPISVTPNPVLLNGTVNTSANFTDADTADTHTASWSWGDSSSSAGVVTETSGSGSVTGSHIYSAVGTYTITLTVTDDHGNVATRTTTVQVTYGICLLYDSTKAVKSGSTYPIKLQLCDANGSNVSASSIVVKAQSVQLVSASESLDVIDAGNANPDNNFRYDSSLGGTGGYIFNLKTTGLGTGVYNLYFTAGTDPVLHSVEFRVK